MSESSANNQIMAECPASDPNDDRVVCLISKLNFQRPDEVMAVFRSASNAAKKKLVLKICSIDNYLFFRYLLANSDFRQEYLRLREEAHPNGIIARQPVVREVVNNPFITCESTKYYGLCHYDPTSISTFLMSTLKMIWGPNVSNLKVLVVVEGDYFSQRLVEKLNTVGYAFWTQNAPGNKQKAYMQQLDNWPTFLVTPELFSGQGFVRMDFAAMLGRVPEQQDAVALEIKMADSKCTHSAIITPPEHRPLAMLAEIYIDLPQNMPIRI